MSKFSVKKPFTVLVAVIAAITLGFVSLSKLQLDLLPEISLPYLIVITTYPGASAEKVEEEVCKPMEDALGTINGVENIYSICNENYGMVELEFQDGTDLDSAMVKVSSALNTLESYLPDDCGTPSIMEIGTNLMASIYLAVSMEGMSAEELSQFVEDNVTATVAWNKLYHKSLFGDIRYPFGKLYEDEFVTYKILYKAGSIAVCDEKLYMYFVNNEGITKSEWSIKHLDAIEALEERDEWIVKHKLWEYRNWTKKHLLQVYQWQYFQLKNEKQYHKYRKNISKKIRKILLTQRKQLGIDINNYSDCYYIVFPIAMRIYGAYNIYLKKYKENGFMYAIKAVITHISKR